MGFFKKVDDSCKLNGFGRDSRDGEADGHFENGDR